MKNTIVDGLTPFTRTLKHIGNNKTLLAVVVVGGLLAVWFGVFSSTQKEAEEVYPTRQSLRQLVKVSGKVQAAQEANLSFQSSGNVSYVGVKIGDTVSQGKVLATLYSGDEQANVLQAKATLANVQATLNQLISGARPEELAIKEQAVKSAQGTLDATYATLPDTIRNVDATIGDTVKNKLAPLFTYSGTRYIMSFSSCDQTLQSQVEEARTALELKLATFQKSATAVSMMSSNDTVDKAFDEAYRATLETNDFISKVSNLLLSSCSVGNTSLDTYRTTLATVRTTMNTVFTDISTKRSALSTAKNTLAQTERDLTLTKAGTDQAKIDAQRALVSQAEASVLSAEARLSKTIIQAPFTGIVTDVTLSRGETASVGKTVIGLISASAFEVEATVPEIDIAKVALGNEVEITLDAYGASEAFPATITRVDPAATFEGNVPKYKVIATFTKNNERVKTGMTANLTIVTKRVADTLSLPVRFVEVIDANRGRVIVKTGEVTKDVDVTIGIRSDDGLIEIKGGLNENDAVVAIQPGERAAQKQTQ
jgi:HlyD family secretion protein